MPRAPEAAALASKDPYQRLSKGILGKFLRRDLFGLWKTGFDFWLSILVKIAPSMNAELALSAEGNVRVARSGKAASLLPEFWHMVAEHGGEGEGGGCRTCSFSVICHGNPL